MLAVGHDLHKVNLQLENKAGLKDIVDKCKAMLKELGAESKPVVAPLSASKQRKIAFEVTKQFGRYFA
jgi:hypothetical protein